MELEEVDLHGHHKVVYPANVVAHVSPVAPTEEKPDKVFQHKRHSPSSANTESIPDTPTYLRSFELPDTGEPEPDELLSTERVNTGE
jgi:hypothetical protein